MSMSTIALAVVLGLATFPLVLVFGPVYFPWSILVLACFGGVVGLSLAPGDARPLLPRAAGLALLMVTVVLAVLGLTSKVVWSAGTLVFAVVWTVGILVPLLFGVLVGAWLRARSGVRRGAATGAAAVIAIALIGTGLAFAAAPAEIAGAPTCDRGFECPRTQCAFMAERRRLFAIERVTAFDGERLTCTYTAWGGIDVGRAEMDRRGGSWTDGAWPRMWSGRGN
jgi:hypothetical protein